MEIVSTNLGEAKTVEWNGKNIQTGIYKYPTHEPLLLENTDVAKDAVIDRKHHGGLHKACYVFSTEHYPFWKEKYPNLDWQWGMFGENLTVTQLDETKTYIGNIYNVGQAVVQISEPRQPCFKLGIRFKDQNIIKEFLSHSGSGTYLRIIKKGIVKVGDVFELKEEADIPLTIYDYYRLATNQTKSKTIMELASLSKGLRADKQLFYKNKLTK